MIDALILLSIDKNMQLNIHTLANRYINEKIILKTKDGEVILYSGIEINAVKLQKIDHNFSIIQIFLKSGNKIEFTIEDDKIEDIINKLFNVKNINE